MAVRPPQPSGAPVLTTEPDRILTAEHAFKTTIVTFENQNEQRFCEQENERRTLLLQWSYARNDTDHPTTLSIVQMLTKFFKDRKGQYEAWYVYNWHENVYIKVRFKEESLKIAYINTEFAGIQVEVIECLN